MSRIIRSYECYVALIRVTVMKARAEAAKQGISQFSELNDLATLCHETNTLKWKVEEAGKPVKLDKSEMITLMYSTLGDANHGVVHNKPDTRLPHRSMEEVSLTDCLIRILDYCGKCEIDLSKIFSEKLEYNKTLNEGEYVWLTGTLDEDEL